MLDVHGELPVRYLSVLKGRKQISVAFVDFPHDPMLLRIEAVSGKIDERKQTVAVRCGLDNRQRIFRPGLRVRMYFPGERHANALVIPRSALLEEEGVFSAFVAEQDRARKRRLKVGIKGDDQIEVLSGLKENERVITKNAYSLTDGMKVILE
jgi:membrane fusion protein (multidrug efflux system)